MKKLHGLSGYYSMTTTLFFKYFTVLKFNTDIFEHREIPIMKMILWECLYH